MRTLDDLMPPLSARSVALSLLLGSRPPQMAASDLVRLGAHFDIAPATMRVALSRMTAAGDVVVSDAVYSLGDRHAVRQSVTEELVHPRRRPYTGMWRTVVVVAAGRPAEERQALRSTMARFRFAELREGVWLRPDNLDEPGPATDTALRVFSSLPDDDRALSRELWNLADWAGEARLLLGALREGAAAPVVRLTAAAAAVRLLRDDPVLPEELAPEHWPADELHQAYEDFRGELTALSVSDATPTLHHTSKEQS
ncbi:PaaX family transcriptional regulator C-terminal domain-containing protein [Microbacterium sp. BWT-B31]|uniref:PaaX family transcriptional regulator C-terminal domain-containing protein n=1 Tax=Microbacterium sp. BWT-B31 TaxID=3232072 RepID=UPI003526D90F